MRDPCFPAGLLLMSNEQPWITGIKRLLVVASETSKSTLEPSCTWVLYRLAMLLHSSHQPFSDSLAGHRFELRLCQSRYLLLRLYSLWPQQSSRIDSSIGFRLSSLAVASPASAMEYYSTWYTYAWASDTLRCSWSRQVAILLNLFVWSGCRTTLVATTNVASQVPCKSVSATSEVS